MEEGGHITADTHPDKSLMTDCALLGEILQIGCVRVCVCFASDENKEGKYKFLHLTFKLLR